MTLGERIVKLREYGAYSQKELAEKLCVAPQTLVRYEKDKVKPSFEFIAKLTDLFINCNARWLLTGKGEMLLNEEKSESVNKNFSGNQIVTGDNNNLGNGTINNGTPVKEEPKAVQKNADIEQMCAMMVQYAPREYVQQVRGKLEAFRELVGAG